MPRPGSAMIDDARLADLLRDRWGLTGRDIRPLSGGMNSRTWWITGGGSPFVAKAVPSERAGSFAAGLAAAAHVEAAGIPAGAPAAALDGTTVVTVGSASVALLRYVPGDALRGDGEGERRRMGAVLGRAHRALAGAVIVGTWRFPWIDPAAAHLDVRPGVCEAVTDALAAWERLPPTALTWGIVHSDPAPEAFRYDAGRAACGLIDWDLGLEAPRMYDVASAVMYLGGRGRAAPFLEAYLATGALTTGEVRRTLRPMLRLRWAVQADYFARRIADDDLTGIADPAENETGLDDAVRGLERHRDA